MLETFEMDKVDQALRWPGGGDTTTSPNHERSVCSCLSGVLNPPPIPCIETGYRSTCHFVSRLQCCGLE